MGASELKLIRWCEAGVFIAAKLKEERDELRIDMAGLSEDV